MIKAENYVKITENFRYLPGNSLKNPKILSPRLARRWGVRLRRTGGFCQFFDDRGVLADPPLAMPVYNHI